MQGEALIKNMQTYDYKKIAGYSSQLSFKMQFPKICF